MPRYQPSALKAISCGLGQLESPGQLLPALGSLTNTIFYKCQNIKIVEKHGFKILLPHLQNGENQKVVPDTQKVLPQWNLIVVIEI